METSLLQITSGKEIHNDKSCQVTAFWSPNRADHKAAKARETFLSAAAKVDSGITRFSSQGRITAVKGHNSDCGFWDTSTYTVDEGTIIKFYIAVDSGWGNTEVKANVYIQTRSAAAMRTLRIPLLDVRKSEIPYIDITGRFDVLADPEAIELAGAVMKPAFKFMTSEVRTSRATQTIEISPEIAPKPVTAVKKITVTSDEGVTTSRVVVRRKKRRAID